jgi:hypothetical protein
MAVVVKMILIQCGCGFISEGEGLVGLGPSMLNRGKRELRSLERYDLNVWLAADTGRWG